MTNYKITIITPVKNDHKNIEKTIKSIIKQTYKNYEHIVIDGKSTDDTLKILKKYKKKIKIISKKDVNLWQAINRGINKSKGDIIGVLNSKDILYPKALENVNNYFNKFNIDYLFGAVKKKKIFYKFEPEKINYRLNIYPSHSCSFFIKRKAQKEIGLYKIKYDYCSDYDLFYRLFNNKKLRGINSKKNEVFGKFDLNGISSKIPFYKFYFIEMRIRFDNGQNFFYLFFLFLTKIANKFLNEMKIKWLEL